MKKYIDAEELKIELNKRIELLENGVAHPEVMKRVRGVIQGYKAALSIIDSLQQVQLEVNFETEYAKFSNDTDADYPFPIDLADYKDFARHFYELGLNTRKEK